MGALIALLLLAAAPAAAQPRAQGAASNVPGPSGTAGEPLMEVWRQARLRYHDALLVSISAQTEADGRPVCSPRAPFQDGWRYSFYSPSQVKFVMMAECRGKIAGPLVSLHSGDASTRTIAGKFIDSDVAMRTLERAGISLDPFDHKVSGKRPFSLKLYRLDDRRAASHPVLWRIEIGKSYYLVDAEANEIFSPQKHGLTVEISTASSSEALSRRPKKADVYTVKKDLDRVMEYARKSFPGSNLMAVEGFMDAWGATPCTGPGDGWAFYFYYPRSRGFEVVYACNGYIGPGPAKYIPVDLNDHVALSGLFVDSDKIADTLLVKHPAAMNEGLGRSYSRLGTLLLRNHRVSPFAAAGVWDVTMVWQVTLGRTLYRFDGRDGRLMDVQELR